MPRPLPLTLAERIEAEDALFRRLAHVGESRIKGFALGVAVLVHVAALLIRFPAPATPVAAEPEPHRSVGVAGDQSRPPEAAPHRPGGVAVPPGLSVPDPTPDESGPIREPEPEVQPERLPPGGDLLLGVPEPPPSGPLLAGVGGVSQPRIIVETQVEPGFPEIARLAKLEGSVILRAVVQKDGTIGEATVLRCNRPNVGFEDSALRALRKWRYEPARRGGEPVDAYITIVVDFEWP